MNETNKYWIAAAIGLGLILNGFFIGRAVQRFKKEDRSVSVKGFAEKEVKANQAVWTIKTRVTTNDLSDGSREIEASKQKIVNFLIQKGIKKEEIIQQNLSVTDKVAQDYSGANYGEYRYIIENTLQVRTGDVDNVQSISRMTDELLKVGVVISNSNDYNPAVQYLYTQLNDIKPQMLSEATQNARKAADQFAKESGVGLGDIKKANQGLFTIIDRDDSNASQGGEGGYSPSSVNDLYKKVRVVVNIEYSID
ncbi:MAG: SIMPL domain-containing protein [Spirosomataceae bacterium]|jgi:hypothetical protein